jgi:type I restriction enzyme S subunit
MEWPKAQLASLCEVFTDGDWIESKSQSPEGVRLIQTGNVGEGNFKDRRDKSRFISEETFDDLKCCEIFEGDCLVSRLPDPVGRSCILPKSGDRMITAVDCTILRFKKDKLTPEFFNYFSQSLLYLNTVESLTSGATRKRISRKNLGLVEIPTPPIPEQKRIVAILDQAFADIEQARAKTEQNLKNARELFESYLQQVFSQRGEGWVEKKIGDLTALITKGSSPKWQGINYVEEPGILFVTSENVGVNQMIYKKTKYVEEAFNTKGPKSILSKGDVLTNIVGASIGRTAIFDRDDVANINQAVCLMRCNPEVLYNEYLAYLLNSPYLVKILHDNEIDNARANLSLGFFRNLGIPLPSVETQKILVEQIKVMHLKTDNLEVIYQRKLASLDELKKSILQKAFSGELTKTPDKETSKGAAA